MEQETINTTFSLKRTILWLCLIVPIQLFIIYYYYFDYSFLNRIFSSSSNNSNTKEQSILNINNQDLILLSNFSTCFNHGNSHQHHLSIRETILQQLKPSFHSQQQQHTSESISKLFKLLLEFKYIRDDGVDHDDHEIMNNIQQMMNENAFPIRIYVYPLSENGKKMLETTLDLCKNHSFDNESMIFFPHSYIDCYFHDFITNSSTNGNFIEKVENIQEAHLAYIPIPLDLNFYDNINKKEGEKDFLNLTRKISSDFHNEMSFQVDMESNFHKIPHFIVYPYVSYRVSFNGIPKPVKIVTLENVAISGSPQNAWYDNGCQDRCLTIPYATIFDWPSYYGNDPTNFNENHENIQWKNRPYQLSFIGSLNRTEILFTHRYHLVTKLSEFKNHFHTFKESISTSSNIEIYGKSKFCLQLHGDTPTRNAFYESLLMDCIPVITEKTFMSYRSLFGYLLPLEEFTVVIDNKYTEEHVGVKEIIERLIQIDRNGEFERMLNIFKSLSFFMRYKNYESGNLLPILAILKWKIPLSIPPRYSTRETLKNFDSADIFMKRPIEKGYKWMNLTSQFNHVEFKKENCKKFNGKIYIPPFYHDLTLNSLRNDRVDGIEIDLPTLMEFTLIQRFKNENLLVNQTEHATMIFYPYNINHLLDHDGDLEQFVGMKGFLISNNTGNESLAKTIENVKRISSIFNETLIYTLSPHIIDEVNVRNLPFITIGDDLNMEISLLNRNSLLCSLKNDENDEISQLLEFHFGNEFSHLFSKINSSSDLVNCDYMILSNENPFLSLHQAIQYGAIPISNNFNHFHNEIFHLENFSQIILQIPKPIQQLHKNLELFSNWLIRFLQFISFEEIQERKRSLSLLRKYFSLSNVKNSQDFASLFMCSLEY